MAFCQSWCILKLGAHKNDFGAVLQKDLASHLWHRLDLEQMVK